MTHLHFVLSGILASFALSASTMLASTSAESGDTVLFDFNNLAAPPKLGGQWNTIPRRTIGVEAFHTTDGRWSSITLDFEGPWNDASDILQPESWNNGQPLDWVDPNAVRDYFWIGNDQQARLVIGGLDPDARYQLSLVSARQTSRGERRWANFYLNGVPATGEVPSESYSAKKEGWDRASLLHWQDMQPDASGRLKLEIDTRRMNGIASAFVNALRVAGPSAVVEPPEPEPFPYPFPSHYPLVEEIYSWFEGLEAEYPELIRSAVIGQSVNGIDILAYQIAADGDSPLANRPALLVDGGMHGDEIEGVQLLLYTTWRLLRGYGEDPAVSWLLHNRVFYFVPVLNPDGYGRGGRLNSNGVDLNRNWDANWQPGGTRHGESANSEPETLALSAYAHSLPRLDAYVNLHSWRNRFDAFYIYIGDPETYGGIPEHAAWTSSMMQRQRQLAWSPVLNQGEVAYIVESGHTTRNRARSWFYREFRIPAFVVELPALRSLNNRGKPHIMETNEGFSDALLHMARICDISLIDELGDNRLPADPYVIYGQLPEHPETAIAVTNLETGEVLQTRTDENGYYELNLGRFVAWDSSNLLRWNANGVGFRDFRAGAEWGQRIDL